MADYQEQFRPDGMVIENAATVLSRISGLEPVFAVIDAATSKATLLFPTRLAEPGMMVAWTYGYGPSELSEEHANHLRNAATKLTLGQKHVLAKTATKAMQQYAELHPEPNLIVVRGDTPAYKALRYRKV